MTPSKCNRDMNTHLIYIKNVWKKKTLPPHFKTPSHTTVNNITYSTFYQFKIWLWPYKQPKDMHTLAQAFCPIVRCLMYWEGNCISSLGLFALFNVSVMATNNKKNRRNHLECFSCRDQYKHFILQNCAKALLVPQGASVSWKNSNKTSPQAFGCETLRHQSAIVMKRRTSAHPCLWPRQST